MKYQVLFSLRNNEKNIQDYRLAAVVIGTLRYNGLIYNVTFTDNNLRPLLPA